MTPAPGVESAEDFERWIRSGFPVSEQLIREIKSRDAAIRAEQKESLKQREEMMARMAEIVEMFLEIEKGMMKFHSGFGSPEKSLGQTQCEEILSDYDRMKGEADGH